MGLEQSRQLSEVIKSVEQRFPEDIKRHISNAPMLKGITNMLKRAGGECYERLKGIANGASMSLESIILLNIGANALIKFGEIIGVPREKSIYKEPIIGKNFYEFSTYGEIVIRYSCPNTGYWSVEVTKPFMAGAFDGINEEGLGISYIPLCENKLPFHFCLQNVLQRCATIDEVLKLISEEFNQYSGIMVVGDETGRLAKVMLANEKISVISAEREGIIVEIMGIKERNKLRMKKMIIKKFSEGVIKTKDLLKILQNARYFAGTDTQKAILIEPVRKKLLVAVNHQNPIECTL